jgi:hypothetical protein
MSSYLLIKSVFLLKYDLRFVNLSSSAKDSKVVTILCEGVFQVARISLISFCLIPFLIKLPDFQGFSHDKIVFIVIQWASLKIKKSRYIH